MTAVLTDAATMTRRNLLHIARTPQLVGFVLVGPTILVLLFNVVFGGSIATGNLAYIDYLIPGILVQTAVFDGTNTAIALAQDRDRGTINRFRSLPMSRAAVLLGRVAADAARVAVTASVVVLLGLALGFRATNGVGTLALAVALTVAFGQIFAWAYTLLALQVKETEAIQAAGWIPIFPLVFAASTFAPVQNMPSWLQPFAEHQPVTVTVDAIRALVHGGDLAGPLAQSLAWTAVLVVGFATLSIRRFDHG